MRARPMVMSLLQVAIQTIKLVLRNRSFVQLSAIRFIDQLYAQSALGDPLRLHAGAGVSLWLGPEDKEGVAHARTAFESGHAGASVFLDADGTILDVVGFADLEVNVSLNTPQLTFFRLTLVTVSE